jgi:hypothetical protein
VIDSAKEFVHLLPQNPGLGPEYEIGLVAAAVADYQHRLATRIYSEVERATADRLLRGDTKDVVADTFPRLRKESR